MAKRFENLDEGLVDFIGKQCIFFVGMAGADGFVAQRLVAVRREEPQYKGSDKRDRGIFHGKVGLLRKAPETSVPEERA